jgi:hypothetical protein
MRQRPGCGSRSWPEMRGRAARPPCRYRPPRCEPRAACSVNEPAEQAAVLTVAAFRL